MRHRCVDVDIDLAYHRVVDRGDRRVLIHRIERKGGRAVLLVADDPLLELVAFALRSLDGERRALPDLVIFELCSIRRNTGVGLFDRHRPRIKVVDDVVDAIRIGRDAVLLRPDHKVVHAHGLRVAREEDGVSVALHITLHPVVAVIVIHAVLDGRTVGGAAGGDLELAVDELVGIVGHGIDAPGHVDRRRLYRFRSLGHGHLYRHRVHVHRNLDFALIARDGDMHRYLAARGHGDHAVLDEVAQAGILAPVNVQLHGGADVRLGRDLDGQGVEEIDLGRAHLRRGVHGVNANNRGLRGLELGGLYVQRAVVAALHLCGLSAFLVAGLHGHRGALAAAKVQAGLRVVIDPDARHVGRAALGRAAHLLLAAIGGDLVPAHLDRCSCSAARAVIRAYEGGLRRQLLARFGRRHGQLARGHAVGVDRDQVHVVLRHGEREAGLVGAGLRDVAVDGVQAGRLVAVPVPKDLVRIL